jgi:hypothetical protein
MLQIPMFLKVNKKREQCAKFREMFQTWSAAAKKTRAIQLERSVRHSAGRSRLGRYD